MHDCVEIELTLVLVPNHTYQWRYSLMVGSLGLGASGSVISFSREIIHHQQLPMHMNKCASMCSSSTLQSRLPMPGACMCGCAGLDETTYERVEAVAAAGDAHERLVGGHGRLDVAAVADVLGGVGHGHVHRRHEQVHHLPDHPPHHQRINEPRHAISSLLSFSFSLL